MASQATYGPLASNVRKVERLYVNSQPYGRADKETYEGLRDGTLRWTGTGMYFVEPNSTGLSRNITLYPTPSQAGLTIEARVVLSPTYMTSDTDVPSVPDEFQHAIRDYAAGQALLLVEDNPELSQYYMERFNERVEALFALRNSRDTDASVTMQIQGIHY